MRGGGGVLGREREEDDREREKDRETALHFMTLEEVFMSWLTLTEFAPTPVCHPNVLSGSGSPI